MCSRPRSTLRTAPSDLDRARVGLADALLELSTSGGKPIAFAIALSISKPGFSILPLRGFRHLRASHDASAGPVEILPSPPAAVRATIEIQEVLELLRDLDHGSRLLSLGAAVRLAIPHTGSLNLRDIPQRR